jgi:hypothetical protein
MHAVFQKVFEQNGAKQTVPFFEVGAVRARVQQIGFLKARGESHKKRGCHLTFLL